MTRYEQGFMAKCAEYGVPEHIAGQMLKAARNQATPITKRAGLLSGVRNAAQAVGAAGKRALGAAGSVIKNNVLGRHFLNELNDIALSSYKTPPGKVSMGNIIRAGQVGSSLPRTGLIDENWNFTPAATNLVESIGPQLASRWQGVPVRPDDKYNVATSGASTNLWPALDFARDAAQWAAEKEAPYR